MWDTIFCECLLECLKLNTSLLFNDNCTLYTVYYLQIFKSRLFLSKWLWTVVCYICIYTSLYLSDDLITLACGDQLLNLENVALEIHMCVLLVLTNSSVYYIIKKIICYTIPVLFLEGHISAEFSSSMLHQNLLLAYIK